MLDVVQLVAKLKVLEVEELLVLGRQLGFLRTPQEGNESIPEDWKVDGGSANNDLPLHDLLVDELLDDLQDPLVVVIHDGIVRLVNNDEPHILEIEGSVRDEFEDGFGDPAEDVPLEVFSFFILVEMLDNL